MLSEIKEITKMDSKRKMQYCYDFHSPNPSSENSRNKLIHCEREIKGYFNHDRIVHDRVYQSMMILSCLFFTRFLKNIF